ncbi:MAG TPA: GNAT family N-acetyltransferase [Opitutaceae bacterium]|nr:GNAT family N-acetyltransferase [Opitutaceae bacterium]
MPEIHPAATAAFSDAILSVSGEVVQRVNPLDDFHWDAKLANCPGVSFFHGAAWARVLCDTYGYTPTYFIISEAGSIRSLLPFMEVNSWLTGRRGVALPFTDECEPVCSNRAHFHRLWHEALNFAKRRGWKYAECRGGKCFFDERPASTSFFGHRLDLQHNESDLFSKVDGSVRRAIRKANQSGLTVEFSHSFEAVRSFYFLLCKTRKRHGLPPQPYPFFQNIYRYILKMRKGCVVLAKLGQVPVAGAFFFHFGRTALYKFGASDDTLQHLRANNLVMWEAIKWHRKQDFEILDFGRTSRSNEGLRKFKLGWGTIEKTVDYLRYDCRADDFVIAKDEASGWHNRIFKLLPEVLSRAVGSALYKHVA